MKTKIVYSVISDETDIYLEQALLSIYSLRKYNPDAFVELIVDQTTNNSIIGKRSEIKKYVSKITAVNVPNEFSKGQKSRWLKTNLRNLIKGDYLFIDNDTIIADTLEEIDEFESEIGAVKDKHAQIELNKDKDKLLLWSEQDGWTYSDDLTYFNSGVMFVRDCEFTHDFYREWNKRWQICSTDYHRFFDQSSLAATNEFYHYPVKELTGEWNCQPTNGISYLHKAKIIHYWGYNREYYAWMFYDKNIIKKIKELGYVTEEISDLIDRAKEAFIIPNEIIAGKELEFYYSPAFQACKSFKKVFALYNFTSLLLFRLLKFRQWIRNKL